MNNQFYTMYPYMNNVPLRGINAVNGVSSMPRGGLLSSLLGRSAVPGIGATRTFSFNNLLNGASKTLGVINQAIPVVNQIKPIWNNAKTMFRVAKELNSSDNKSISNNTNNSNDDTNTKSNIPNNSNSNNNPQFFI